MTDARRDQRHSCAGAAAGVRPVRSPSRSANRRPRALQRACAPAAPFFTCFIELPQRPQVSGADAVYPVNPSTGRSRFLTESLPCFRPSGPVFLPRASPSSSSRSSPPR
ncbi:hypothetical protein EMIT0158MI4_170096 [Burkholderia ambifaria]